MTPRLLTPLTLICLLCSGAARPPATAPTSRPVVAVPPPPTTPIRTDQTIPRQTLDAMYRRELGQLYTTELAPKLFAAHELMEQYFAATQAVRRKAAVAQLQALNVDPNILGRLVRIRMHWPELRPGVYYVNERVGPHQVIYFLGIPSGYDRAVPRPLVIQLPGAHAFVTDPAPTADQVARIYTAWVLHELRTHPDAVVIMPLLNLRELWGPSYKGMNNVVQPLQHAMARVNIDPARVYLLGHGMSGHATWNLALHYPTYFAAINPLAGGASASWQRVRVPNLRNTFCVVWHDADDPVMKVDMARDLVKVLQKNKLDVDYEETTQLGHAPTPQLLEKLYGKMRSRTRALYPKQVSLGSNRPDSLFNRNDWLQVYQQLSPGAEKKHSVILGSGSITLQQNNYEITATLASANQIEITSRNVESIRLYLNDQLVDLSKPVRVLFNRVPRFTGMVRPSVEEMLKDQLFLGRGWRYYTAYVDVDFGAPATRPVTAPTTRRGRIEYTPPR